jgi:hypothetical protein
VKRASLADLERMLVYAQARAYDDNWLVRMDGRKDVAKLEKQIARLRRKQPKVNPMKRLKKGSAEAKAFMARIRKLRGKKKLRTNQKHKRRKLRHVSALAKKPRRKVRKLRRHLRKNPRRSLATKIHALERQLGVRTLSGMPPKARVRQLRKLRRNPGRSGVRIVHNKLLGGWFIVRGPHHTPLGGRFNSKAEAQNFIDRGHASRVAHVVSAYKKTYQNPCRKKRRATRKTSALAGHYIAGRVGRKAGFYTGHSFDSNPALAMRFATKGEALRKAHAVADSSDVPCVVYSGGTRAETVGRQLGL